MMMRKVCMCAGLEWWLISRKKDQVGVLINQINIHIQLIHHESSMRNEICVRLIQLKLKPALQINPLSDKSMAK